MEILHLNKNLGIADFPCQGVGEVRVYHPLKHDDDADPFKKELDKRPSLKIRRKIQDKYVVSVRPKRRSPHRYVRLSGKAAAPPSPPQEPTMLDELLTLGSLEQRVAFSSAVGTDNTDGVGRALIASCYGQSYTNTTIRKEIKDTGVAAFDPGYEQAKAIWTEIKKEQTSQAAGGQKKAISIAVPIVYTNFADRANKRSKVNFTSFDIQPEFAPDTERGEKEGDFLFSLYDLCDVLFEKIPKDEEKGTPLPGLIVIAGGTGSGKSEITRGLIHEFMTKLIASCKKDNKKHPHLLTIENPIEKYLFTYSNDCKGEPLDKTKTLLLKKAAHLPPQYVQDYLGIDYTPRQMPEDTPSLEQALMRDALRQTPDLVYVGEIREPHEFKTVMDFAETGHAVITTMHAGSLREAMQRILVGANVETSAERGAIASRINAVIHVEKMMSSVNGANVTLPAMWLRNNSAIANLVADGLSSLSAGRQAERSKRTGNERQDALVAYCLGRSYFLETLVGENVKDPKYKEVLTEAIARDMDIAFKPFKPTNKA